MACCTRHVGPVSSLTAELYHVERVEGDLGVRDASSPTAFS